jgi:hypothetical protein
MNNLDYIVRKFNVDRGAPPPVFIPTGVRADLAKLYGELGFKVGAEIGVERGVYAEQICQATPGVKLYCIDCWQIYNGCPEYDQQTRLDAYYQEAKTRLAPYNCEFIKKYSLDAVGDFPPESLDFVYIDANHKFDYVMSDIIFWSKIVKPGGIVSGHDYHKSRDPRANFQVIEAVNVYANVHQIKSWFVLNNEGCASWFWVKG